MERMESPDTLTTSELKEKGLQLKGGWNGTLANDLVVASRQPHIVKATPGDSSRRFKDWESAMDWYEHCKRYIYSLRDQEGQLAGIIWYDDRPRPDLNATHTFAIRLYEQSVGKGIALDFMKAAHDDFKNQTDQATVWLETDVKNTPARRLYDRFGYQAVNEHDGRITMVLKPVDRIANFYDNHGPYGY